MEVLFILIAISLLVAGSFLVVFIISVKRGQFDDTYTPSIRMLLDDDSPQGDDNEDEEKINDQ